MHRFLTILLLLLAGRLPAAGASVEVPLKSLSLPQLEQRLAEMDSELEQLASYSLRSGMGAVGYESQTYKQPNNEEWIRIDLDKEYPIDQVILVPSLWRDSATGLRAGSFPLEFRILAGTAHTTNIVASYTEEDQLLPRIAPLIVPCGSPLNASWIEVEVSLLSLHDWSQKYVLQLSEIMVFSGGENIAINQPVSVTNPKIRMNEGRRPQYLTDGFAPYLMDAAQGKSSKAYILNTGKTSRQRALTIDLEKPCPISQINLHTVDLSHSVPEAAPNGFAMPKRLRVTGANQPDFSDETVLFEHQRTSIYDTGPILIRRFPEAVCRYVRITALELQPNTAFQKGRFTLGFAEIEVLSNGRNVALEKPATSRNFPEHALKQILDGRNYYGKILPIKDWMNQLARRHDLETERPLVVAELNRRYTRQQITLRLMIWLAALLAVVIGFIILIDRMLRQRAILKTRERIAANLHDELGANLHAIGMLGDLAKAETGANERLIEIATRIRALTERTGKAARACTHMLESKGICDNLMDEMKNASYRLLADVDHKLSFQGEEFIFRLNSHKRIDLFLFYKECLTNILRHSDATHIVTQLTGSPKEIRLTITDNGQGIESIPPSLTRRARLMRARVNLSHPESNRTEVTLTLPIRKSLRRTNLGT